MSYDKRYIARIIIEAETPLSVGSGEKGLVTDRLVAKDANGLPYIPGTSLAGVLRSSLDDKKLADALFGFGGENGEGSRVLLSSAHLVGEDGKMVMEGLKDFNGQAGYYSYFSRLPERDHVRMTDKGSADTAHHGKYDEELVHKGARFVFSLELIAEDKDSENWKLLLDKLGSPLFRIGAGTRKGFGKIKIVSDQSFYQEFDLTVKEQLNQYLKLSSSLNESTQGWERILLSQSSEQIGWEKFSLKLQPKDFFLFGAGFGDDDADNKPKTERYIEWSSGKPKLTEQEFLLIPGTSVKGIISHRVAYHYNRAKDVVIQKVGSVSLTTALDENHLNEELAGQFNLDNIDWPSIDERWLELERQIDNLQLEDLKAWKAIEDNINDEIAEPRANQAPVGENNLAVRELFGFAKDSDDSRNSDGLRGRVIIDDIYLPYDKRQEKVFNHTKIDRFTGGTIDGALFQEKAVRYQNPVTIDIWVDKKAFEEDADVKKAFEDTLNDIKSGNLQLGGNSGKGHGVFKAVN